MAREERESVDSDPIGIRDAVQFIVLLGFGACEYVSECGGLCVGGWKAGRHARRIRMSLLLKFQINM